MSKETDEDEWGVLEVFDISYYWYLNYTSEIITLSEYGITYEGSAAQGDIITVTVAEE